MRISLSVAPLLLCFTAIMGQISAPPRPVAQAPLAREAAAADCWPNVAIAASLPTQPAPVFCNLSTQARDTAQRLDNRWIDTFDHGLSFANFSHTNYRVFETTNNIYDSAHWRHANHWMVDIAPSPPHQTFYPTGGTMMRPNRQFWQTDGKIVIEADFAAGHQDYSNLTGWGEIIVTTGAEPTDYRSGGAYGYDMFRGHYTLGCRLQADRHVICALMDTTDNGSANNGRIWEMSFFQEQGAQNTGGFPTEASDPYWRVCAAEGVPDTACRDRFRLELTQDSVTMFVNGYRYFSQTGIPPLPDELFEGSFYVYFASLVGQTNAQVMRFHWDRLTVNPIDAPSAADNFVPPVDTTVLEDNERTACGMTCSY